MASKPTREDATPRDADIDHAALMLASATGSSVGDALYGINAALSVPAAEYADMRIRLEWSMRDTALVRYRQTKRGRVPVADALTHEMARVIRKRGGRR